MSACIIHTVVPDIMLRVLWVAYVAGSIVLHEDKDLRLLLQTIIIFFKENLFHES